jgi:PilZ domain
MPFVLRPYRRFVVQCPVTYSIGPFQGHGTIWNLSCTGCRISGDLPMRPGETLSLTITLPNKKRIEVPEAIVRWSRGQEFAVENVVVEPQTDARLQQYVVRRAQEPPEVVL